MLRRPAAIGSRSSALAGAWRKNGVVEIASEKRIIEWETVKTEYITGASIYALAKKYGISTATIHKRVKKGNWEKLRERTAKEAEKRTIEKTAEATADNATLAADIKRRLLLRIQRIEAQFPQDATEIREDHGQTIYRLRDLTAAYKDLTGDMPKASTADIEDLSPLVELLGGPGHE